MSGQWIFYAAALLSASSWALGSVLWRKLGDRLSPVTMNLSKGFIGSLFLGAALLWSPSGPVAWPSLAVLAASGVIGISVGDTFFFKALVQLGPRLTSLLGTLYPVSIALSATAFLGERPSPKVWCGIFVTMSGVAWVLWERSGSSGGPTRKAVGIWYSFLAMLCTTAAVLLAKIGVEAVPPLQAALVRLVAGTGGLICWGGATRGLSGWVTQLKDPRLLARVIGVVAVVVFGGFWLSLVALKHVDASVAGTLNATSPLFVLPLATFLLNERISARAVCGTAVSVAGVTLILLG